MAVLDLDIEEEEDEEEEVVADEAEEEAEEDFEDLEGEVIVEISVEAAAFTSTAHVSAAAEEAAM